MKQVTYTTFIAALLILCIYCSPPQPAAETTSKMVAAAAPTQEELVARGEYLVTIIGCDHCHTPKKMTDQGPVPDMDRWLMGYPAGDPLPEIDKTQVEPGKWVMLNGDLTAAVGPWGVSFGANLTPHQTGIGTWSFEQFQRSMTEGKYKGLENSRPIMPPMPWQSYRLLKEEDLRAIFEYLQSIEPIENVVPNYIPPPQMN